MPKARWAMDRGSGKRRQAVVGMAAMAAILVWRLSVRHWRKNRKQARQIMRRNWPAPHRTRLRR